MTPQRFHELADAYGGELDRWPAADQAGARALLAAAPALRAGLGAAGRLDALLDSHAVDLPSAALLGRVLAAAPGAPGTVRRARLWWSGLGLAGIGVAGALAGAFAVSVALSAASSPGGDGWTDGGNAFGPALLEWSEE